MKKKNRYDNLKHLLEAEELSKSIPREQYPEIWNELNQFQWHPALGSAPQGWDSMTYKEKMPYIETWNSVLNCSEKEKLRYHHIHNLGRTEQQFEDWWDSKVFQDIMEEIRDYLFFRRSGPVIYIISILAIAISLIAIIMR